MKYIRRNKTIEKRYIYDIAQLTGLSPQQVKNVFKYYILYILHDIAIAEEPKDTIQIYLPCFCSLLIKPNNLKNAKNKLRISIRPETRDNYLKTKLENAYFENEDLLIKLLAEKFTNRVENTLKDRMNKNLDE